MDEDSEFLSSLNVFSGAEQPNHLIRVASLIIITLSASFVSRLLIGFMAKNKGITKKGVQMLLFIAGCLEADEDKSESSKKEKEKQSKNARAKHQRMFQQVMITPIKIPMKRLRRSLRTVLSGIVILIMHI